MPIKRLAWPAALLLLAAGAGFRLWHAFAEPLWLDEAYSAFAADHGFGFLWRVVPRYEVHPPFYYSLLHLWVLAAGDGLAALRLPGLIAGLATLPLVARAAWEAGPMLGLEAPRRRWLALAAFALAALAIEPIEMARQVRPYPFMILVYAGAVLLLVRLRRRAALGLPVGSGTFAAYLLCLELMLWLHNMGPLYAAALTLALAAAVLRPGLSRADLAWLAGGYVAVAALYLPGLAVLMGQAPTWVASSWVRLDGPLVIARIEWLYAGPELAALAAAVLAALGVAVALRGRGDGRMLAVLAILAAVPLLLSLAISVAVAPVFIMRTMTPVMMPAILLYAFGGVAGAGRWRVAGGGALVILLATMTLVDVHARRVGPMEDWYGTVAWLRQRVRPGDLIVAYPNEGALPLGFALRDEGVRLPVRPVPGPVPSFAGPGAWYPNGSRGVVSLTPARLRAIAADPGLAAVPTVWLLRLGRRLYDPRDAALRAFGDGRTVMGVWRAGAIEVVGLGRRPAGDKTSREAR